MKLLSIDPGSEYLGYAIFDDDKLSSYGHVRTSKIKDKHSRVYRTAKEVEELIESQKPDHTVIEEYYSFSRKTGSDVVPNLRGAIFFILSEKKVPFSEVNPKKVKKFVTGNGNAKKKQIKQALVETEDLPTTLRFDTYDAIAIGLTHINRGEKHAKDDH